MKARRPRGDDRRAPLPYRFKDVLAHTHATRSQLIYWTSVALITASSGVTPGTGRHRVFRFANLVEVRVAVLLARCGLKVNATAFVLAFVSRQLRRRRHAADMGMVWVPMDATDVNQVWHGSRKEFALALHGAGLLDPRVGILIDLSSVVADLEQATHDHL